MWHFTSIRFFNVFKNVGGFGVISIDSQTGSFMGWTALIFGLDLQPM